MPRTIDAHHHLWQLSRPFDYRWLDTPDHAPIRRDFLPEDLEPILRANGVDATVVVQTQHDPAENRWALELADRHPFIAGVVGWVDLASETVEAQLSEFQDHPRFAGVRHIVQDEPDDDFLIRPEILRGLRVLETHGVPFDLLLRVRHLRHVPTLARALPTLPMVIDHLAKPDIQGKGFDAWVGDFRAASAFPNVFCKLSGMATEADWKTWTADDLKPYVATALDCFGPDRLMFGSDWPVCELAGSYGRIKRGLEDAFGPLGESDRAAIFGGTATRFYRLGE